jgi:DNA-directed RNA polymerase specialized sigma subunit
MYKRFIQKICVENRNILSARPFFRESAISFSKNVTPCIKKAIPGSKNSTVESIAQAIKDLQKYDINYQLIVFIRDRWLGPFPKTAEVLFQRVHQARTKLIENNMPLAINRAKLFYRKTPKSHLSLMDMIGICAMGLTSAIDKYIGPYSQVFRGVIVGRCVGNLIDQYSETTIHFYPRDRRILYKANSLRSRQGIDDTGELAKAINKSFEQDKIEGKSVPKGKVTTSELNNLMLAASVVSADSTSTPMEGNEGYGVYQYYQDPGHTAEEGLIEKDMTTKLLTSVQGLPILYRKVLRLKGIKI